MKTAIPSRNFTLPFALVDDPVMVAAQQNRVVQRGDATVEPTLQMVTVTVARRPVARLEGAPRSRATSARRR